MTLSIAAWLDGADDCGNDSLLGYWGIAVWISLSIYIFIGLYVLCEEHFVPSLIILGEKLGLSEDVCGATLMAAGSSSPELFTAIIGVFLYPNENPGPSTNCASAAFNMCVIVGLSVLCSGVTQAELHSFPFIRDSFFYGIAALCLYIFYEMVSPGIIELGESIALVSVWVVYVVVLYHDLKVRRGIVYIGRRSGLMTLNAEQMVLSTYSQLPSMSDKKQKGKFLKGYANSHDSMNAGIISHKTLGNDDYDDVLKMGNDSGFDEINSGNSTSTSSSNDDSNSSSSRSDAESGGSSSSSAGGSDSSGSGSSGIDNEVNFRDKKRVVRKAKAMNKKIRTKSLKHKKLRAQRKMAGFSKNSENEDGELSDDLTAMIENYYQDTAVFHSKHAVKPIVNMALEIDAPMNDDNMQVPQEDGSMYFVRTELTPGNANSGGRSGGAIKIVKHFGSNTVSSGDGSSAAGGGGGDARGVSVVSADTRDTSGIGGDDLITESGLWYTFKLAFSMFFSVVIIPFQFLFARTIPKVSNIDINNGNNTNSNTRVNSKLTLAFLISILWMAFLTWLVVDFSNKIGFCLSLTPDVMGLTLLAIGSSVPDTFSSVLVARQGKMGMAVSNALGSNVFDICICVGFSFLLKSILLHGSAVVVETNLGFQSLIIALFVLLAMFVGLLYWSNLIISRMHGWILLVAYGAFVIVFSVVLEEESSQPSV